MNKLILALLAPTAALAACDSAADRAEDQQEARAEASAAASGTAIAALGLTERQLLDADLIDASGTDLGDVEGVARDAKGQVDRLLVEIEDSNPDRFVHIPVAGLKPLPERVGNDTDLQTSMTCAQLAALPDAPLPTAAP